jgi:uncharacterized Fe-S radical SAM superfamily protein PflX
MRATLTVARITVRLKPHCDCRLDTHACACLPWQVGDLVFSADGLAQRGVLLRHLVMPGLVDEGRAILDWVVEALGRCACM